MFIKTLKYLDLYSSEGRGRGGEEKRREERKKRRIKRRQYTGSPVNREMRKEGKIYERKIKTRKKDYGRKV